MVHNADMELSDEEIRVLGCLIEKERATPDQYPLTTNALRTACNQKSNRDPMTAYEVATVEQTMLSLRDRGYARTVSGSGRTVKHKQVLDEALGLTNGEISILGVLMLRGAQTPNELRTRTERLHGFEDNEAVDRTLNQLAAGDRPLVTCIGKQSGQREARWIHLMNGDRPASVPQQQPPAVAPPTGSVSATVPTEATAPAPSASPTPTPPTPAPPTPVPPTPAPPTPVPAGAVVSSGAPARASRMAELETEVALLRSELSELRSRFDELAEQLGG